MEVVFIRRRLLPFGNGYTPTRALELPTLAPGARTPAARPLTSLLRHGRLIPVVVQQLLDEVHVRQQHATAAIALQAQFLQRVTERTEIAAVWVVGVGGAVGS